MTLAEQCGGSTGEAARNEVPEHVVPRVDTCHGAGMKNPLIAARVPPELRDRIDRCAEVATEKAGFGARPIERGDVVRLLVIRALPAYEAELGCAPPPTQTKTAKTTKTTKTTKTAAETKGAKPASKPAKKSTTKK